MAAMIIRIVVSGPEIRYVEIVQIAAPVAQPADCFLRSALWSSESPAEKKKAINIGIKKRKEKVY